MIRHVNGLIMPDLYHECDEMKYHTDLFVNVLNFISTAKTKGFNQEMHTKNEF